ncbi:CPBP family intramembrane glutamic endopeptidase [Pediococcus argentinicus]|nr:CPBP family intramembrane glutamic endopeptidase [Pediococcus argentinicus]NKZ21656.1 CPBP family intramembrane metalloprotease [Pediococcus argentinicus]GEP18757.1 CAAX amino protease [Pediococcus argentinicus]
MSEYLKQHQKYLKNWYLIQLGVMVIIGIVYPILSKMGLLGSIVIAVFVIMLWIIEGLLGLLPFLSRQAVPRKPKTGWQRALRVNSYFQTIIQMFLIPLTLQAITWMLYHYLGINVNVLTVLGMLVLLVAFVPVMVVFTKDVSSIVGRIILLTEVIFAETVGMSFVTTGVNKASESSFLKDLISTGVWGALSFVITVGVLMALWGYRLPSFKFRIKPHWIIFTLLVLFSIWFVTYNAFASGDSWKNFLTAYDFHMKKPSLYMFLSGLEPGIAEEWLYRFSILSLLLYAFRNNKFQVKLSVFISAAIFGVWHLSNALGGQNFLATLEQIIFAFSFGVFAASAYLFTRSLLFTMVFHLFTDALAMMASGTEMMSKPGLSDWIAVSVQGAMFILIGQFLLSKTEKMIPESEILSGGRLDEQASLSNY